MARAFVIQHVPRELELEHARARALFLAQIRGPVHPFAFAEQLERAELFRVSDAAGPAAFYALADEGEGVGCILAAAALPGRSGGLVARLLELVVRQFRGARLVYCLTARAGLARLLERRGWRRQAYPRENPKRGAWRMERALA